MMQAEFSSTSTYPLSVTPSADLGDMDDLIKYMESPDYDQTDVVFLEQQPLQQPTPTPVLHQSSKQLSVVPESALPEQMKHVQDVEMVVQLPARTMHSWSGVQKRKWIVFMLVKYLPRPVPAKLEQRLPLLMQQMVQLQQSQNQLTLEKYIEEIEQQFDANISKKLASELKAWRKVSDVLTAQQVGIKQEPQSFVQGKGSGDLLWEHVLRLLMEGSPTVEWLAKESGLFRFVDSSGAARSWGNTKNNPNMSFEKMSRSIRQYYKEDGSGIIQKATDQPKLHYRFNMAHPDVQAKNIH